MHMWIGNLIPPFSLLRSTLPYLTSPFFTPSHPLTPLLFRNSFRTSICLSTLVRTVSSAWTWLPLKRPRYAWESNKEDEYLEIRLLTFFFLLLYMRVFWRAKENRIRIFTRAHAPTDIFTILRVPFHQYQLKLHPSLSTIHFSLADKQRLLFLDTNEPWLLLFTQSSEKTRNETGRRDDPV